MFGLSQKEKAAEALRRGALAAMTGRYFHHSDAAQFGLNDDAAAFLYTDAIAHQVYALGFVARKALNGKSWATSDFFFMSIGRGIREGEENSGLQKDTMLSVLLKRFEEFEKMPSSEAAQGGRYQDTAERVKSRDPNADKTEICAVLDKATGEYFKDVAQMFD